VSAGWAAACARTAPKSDGGAAGGDVYCWGMNSFAQLGALDGDAGAGIPTPQKVAGFTSDVVDVQIALTTRNVCVRRQDNTVWCWGDNRLGRSGVVEGTGDGCGGNCSGTPTE